MQIEQYNKKFTEWFADPALSKGVQDAVEILKNSKRVFFL